MPVWRGSVSGVSTLRKPSTDQEMANLSEPCVVMQTFDAGECEPLRMGITSSDPDSPTSDLTRSHQAPSPAPGPVISVKGRWAA